MSIAEGLLHRLPRCGTGLLWLAGDSGPTGMLRKDFKDEGRSPVSFIRFTLAAFEKSE